MRLGSFSAIITSMFKDRMTVYRHSPSTADNGSTKITRDEVAVYTNEICKLSFLSDENPKNTDIDQTPILSTPKLFFTSTCILKAGDHVIVNRVDDDNNIIATYEGELGLPSTFVSHQEALFVLRGSA